MFRYRSRVPAIRRLLCALALTGVLALAAPLRAESAGQDALDDANRPVFHVDDASVPDPVRTPGVADKSIKANDLCESEGKSPQVPTAALCESAYSDLRVPEERRYQYECAFVISPEIGGSRTNRNVWLQPKDEAAAKQMLDRAMRKRVCDKTVSLTQAQKEIADDWPGAYRRYVVGDVAVVINEPSGEDQNARKARPASVSGNQPDPSQMSADLSHPGGTNGPPIEASVSMGSGQPGQQSTRRGREDRSDRGRGGSRPAVISRQPTVRAPAASAPHRFSTRGGLRHPGHS